MKFTEIDKIFDSFLLCDINILENENIIKTGKLKMVQLKNNILKFYLDINGVLKIFEYYYPFELKVDDNKIIFKCYVINWQACLKCFSNSLFCFMNQRSKRSS